MFGHEIEKDVDIAFSDDSEPSPKNCFGLDIEKTLAYVNSKRGEGIDKFSSREKLGYMQKALRLAEGFRLSLDVASPGINRFIAVAKIEVDRIVPLAQEERDHQAIKDREWSERRISRRNIAATVHTPIGPGEVVRQAEHDDGEKYERHPKITMDRAIFVLNYFVPGFEDAIDAERGAFIKFLTGLGGKEGPRGNEGEKARQRVSTIRLKDRDSPKTFLEDLKVVRGYAERLGLTDVVKQIDRDLSDY